MTAGTPVYLFVDGFENSTGDYRLTIAEGACTVRVETLCTDGLDNDGDTDTDCNDTDCAADPVCAPFAGTCTIPLILNLAGANTGTIQDVDSNRTGTCGGGGTPEQIWTVAAPVTTDSDLCVTVNATGFTPVLHYRDDTCTQRDGEQDCVNGTGSTASMTVALQPGVVSYIIVDGGPGDYTVTTAAGACP